MRAVFQVAMAKPAATAAIMIAGANHRLRRNNTAANASATAVVAATHSTGS